MVGLPLHYRSLYDFSNLWVAVKELEVSSYKLLYIHIMVTDLKLLISNPVWGTVLSAKPHIFRPASALRSVRRVLELEGNEVPLRGGL